MRYSSHVGDGSVDVLHLEWAIWSNDLEGHTSLTNVVPVGEGVGVLLTLSHWEGNVIAPGGVTVLLLSVEDPSVVLWVNALVGIGNEVNVSKIEINVTVRADLPLVVSILIEDSGTLNHDENLWSLVSGSLSGLVELWLEPVLEGSVGLLDDLVLLVEDSVWLASEEVVLEILGIVLSSPGGNLNSIHLSVDWLDLSGVDELEQFGLSGSDVADLNVKDSGVSISVLSVVVDVSDLLLIGLLGLLLSLLGLVVLNLGKVLGSLGGGKLLHGLLEFHFPLLDLELEFLNKSGLLGLKSTSVINVVSSLGDLNLKIDGLLLKGELDFVLLESSSLVGTSVVLLVLLVDEIHGLNHGLHLLLGGENILEGHVSGGINIVLGELLIVHHELLKRASLKIEGGFLEAALEFLLMLLNFKAFRRILSVVFKALEAFGAGAGF